ncbi:GH13265 [Drosophila grimshawi]|uniref:GH13265 n=1 Tax=Drosophila grimshawi TaxID=7222 RepID=B4JQ56_DROGR|nr:GH13265 [Drosophila grimshawi]
MLMHTTSTTSTATMTNSSSSATPTPGSTSSNNSAMLESLQQQQQQQQHQQLQQQLQQLHTTTATAANNSRPPSRAPSILDSPTLARVERARLRLEQQERERERSSQRSSQGGGGGGGGGGGSSSGTGSTATTMNREDSLERSILDPKKDVAPWHQMWTHMKRLSHASKVNSTNSLTAQKTDVGVGHHQLTANTTTATKATTTTINGGTGRATMPGKCILFPDKTSSLKSSMYTQQVYFRPDMQSLLAGRIPVASMTGPIKRGLLWQQRDRLFSRWKERYFVLTRDYLHCFKRASGSANERASDMGQFIFKVKLVDVEKVEWLNRRSYSAIGLLLGREGRVLLRCDDGLEDWFELLEECTLTSKERRRALKIAQGPRSRASLAAPVSHASLQFQHFGLGSTYSSALDDWLMTNGSGCGGGLARHKIGAGSLNGYAGANPFLFSDSVPDLSALNNENHNHHMSGISTNHSTPQKIPHHSNANLSRYSNGYASAQNSFTQAGGALYGSPRRIFINSSFGSNAVVDEETAEESEVQLRRPRLFRGISAQPDNGNELDRDWLYRKPRAPTDMRHSVQPMLPTHNSNGGSNVGLANKQELDCSAHDSGLDTPPSTHRPSSYREAASRDSTETNGSSSRGTLLNNSPGGSFRGKKLSPQDQRILKMRNNEEERCTSIKLANRLNHNHDQNTTAYDPNQNRYYKNGNATPPISLTPQHTPQHKMLQQANGNGNGNGTLNGNGGSAMNGSAIFRERYQHPALAAIINEAQGLKFRERAHSDSQQRRLNNNNNGPTPTPASPLAQRRNNVPIFGTPTRV